MERYTGPLKTIGVARADLFQIQILEDTIYDRASNWVDFIFAPTIYLY